MDKWFILVGDESGHEYVIPENKSEEWEKWLESEEAELGDVPEWADKKEGLFRFKQYEV